MSKTSEILIAGIVRLAESQERIADALEARNRLPKRKTYGAVIGQAHTLMGKVVSSRGLDYYDKLEKDLQTLVSRLAEKYPDAVYPADLTKHLTPKGIEEMVAVFAKPQKGARDRAWYVRCLLEDAGFWDD